MDQTEILQQIDDALETLPEEVKDFLYKGRFEQALISIAEKLSLSEEQKKDLDYHLTNVVALIEHRDDLLVLCDTWNFSPEQKKVFADEVEKNIFIPLIETTNYVEEDEEAPSPTDVFESLKSRLTEAKSIAPSARSLDTSRPIAPAPENLPTAPAKPSFDPYREIPGK